VAGGTATEISRIAGSSVRPDLGGLTAKHCAEIFPDDPEFAVNICAFPTFLQHCGEAWIVAG
jgi:hypothetical protein